MVKPGAVSDAFLSHNRLDKPIVKEIGHWLETQAGLQVWLDEWNLVPGDPWQEALEEAIESARSIVVFFGSSGISPWQNEEMRAALERRASRDDVRVVPVLLPGSEKPSKETQLPAFVRRLLWVQFEESWNEEEALHRLRCGIQGIPPKHSADSATAGLADSRFVNVCPYRGLEVFRPEDRRHPDSVQGALWSDDESQVLTWSFDRTMRIWDVSSGKQIGPSLLPEEWIRGASWSPDASRILTWSDYDYNWKVRIGIPPAESRSNRASSMKTQSWGRCGAGMGAGR